MALAERLEAEAGEWDEEKGLSLRCWSESKVRIASTPEGAEAQAVSPRQSVLEGAARFQGTTSVHTHEHDMIGPCPSYGFDYP